MQFKPTRKLLLIIMDGIGVSRHSQGNAVTSAAPSNLEKMWNTSPHTYLLAASEAVGLPPATNGNSEVGHLNIGAGRVMYQNLPRINKSIANGNFFKNQTLEEAYRHAKKNRSNVHIMGCLSDGAVHSDISHFIATLKFFSQKKLKHSQVLIHAFTDGRDSPQKSAEKYLSELESKINELGVGQLATVCGRSIAMDRNKTWDRTQKAYEMLVNSKGEKFNNWEEVLQKSYSEGKTDEFIEPSILVKSPVSDKDVVLYLNFRSDRAVQLTQAFVDADFDNFTVKQFKNLFFASMVEYKKDFPEKVIFPKEYIKLPLGRVISEEGLTQLRIAESEKFPHVTYFLNGGISLINRGENRIEIPSEKGILWDEKPEMNSLTILDVLKERIAYDYYNFIALNLANGDMVGHTGNFEATKLAINVLDYCIGELVKYMVARGGTVVITSDHGNAEEVINAETGKIDTEHSQNPVPFIIIGNQLKKMQLPFGSLSDIAPTILSLMGIDIPGEMLGKPLIPKI
ncbi:2,3-bisphosphoglycerate-independent phosphoglycerate mutase [Candidatus Dojkabacteria bacterium]|nr:2,3-bisphosphoglycerate-independent phosphoglycerate mutase [Candidatus Dojkabacteria bacterium]